MGRRLTNSENDEFLKVVLLLATGFVSFFVFSFGAARTGTFEAFESDIIAHALMTHGQLHGTWWSYSLWYPALRLLTAGGSADQLMINGGFMLLGSIATVRGIITARLLTANGYSHLGATAATGALVSCLALPSFGLTSNFYLGTLTPNSLGSATQLVAMLFAIPAVYFLARWFAEPTTTHLWWVTATGALSALAKAGMTPAWVVGYVVLAALLVRRRLVRLHAMLAIPVVLPLLSILLAYVISFNSRSSSSRIRPFEEWSILSDVIPVDILRSWLLPMLVAAACLHHLGRSESAKWLAAPWLVAVASLVPASLLSELDSDGNVRGYGNFISGASVATTGLYFMSVLMIVRLPRKFRVPLFGLLAVQAILGLVHVWNWTKTGAYF